MAMGVHLDVVKSELENAREYAAGSGETRYKTIGGLHYLGKEIHDTSDSVPPAFLKAAPLYSSKIKLKLTNFLIKDRVYPMSNAGQGYTLVQCTSISC